jgi:hypothetical protein
MRSRNSAIVMGIAVILSSNNYGANQGMGVDCQTIAMREKLYYQNTGDSRFK